MSGYILLSAFVNIYSPENAWYIATFIVGFTVSTWLLLYFLSGNTRQSALFAAGIGIFLLLRALGLHSMVYIILLIASTIAITVGMRRS